MRVDRRDFGEAAKMKKRLSGFFLLILYAVSYLPIITVIVYSFNASKSRAKWGGFSLDWYAALFRDRQIMSACGYTVLCALITAIVSTVLGTAAALGINALSKKNERRIMNVVNLPVLNADIVTGISLMLLFLILRARQGFGTMLLAHITVNTSYVILSVMPGVKKLNPHLFEAAMDLGASPFHVYVNVIIPQLTSVIISGALISFTLSLDDFIISFFTTGNGVSNISILVYSMARRGINPKINALSTLMFATIFILLVLINYRPNEKSGVADANTAERK